MVAYDRAPIVNRPHNLTSDTASQGSHGDADFYGVKDGYQVKLFDTLRLSQIKCTFPPGRAPRQRSFRAPDYFIRRFDSGE